jgi:hypothetical protein
MKDTIKEKIFTSLHEPAYTVSVKTVIGYAEQGQKIALIKEYRALSKCGLKEAKDMIEKFESKKQSSGNSFDTQYAYDIHSLLDAFKAVSRGYTITKEEFVNIISEALDNMDRFHCDDMIEAVEFLLKNIKAKGGLEQVAYDREKFINAI